MSSTSAPLPFAKLKEADAKVHVAFADVRPGVGTFRDRPTPRCGSKMAAWRSMPVQRAESRARSTPCSRSKPAADGAAELDLKVTATHLRAGLGVGGIRAGAEEPPTSAEVILLAPGQHTAADGVGCKRAHPVDAGSGQAAERPDRAGSEAAFSAEPRRQAESVFRAGPRTRCSTAPLHESTSSTARW